MNTCKGYASHTISEYNVKEKLIRDENLIFGFDLTIPYKEQDMICISNYPNDIEEEEIDNRRINQVHFKLLDLYKFQRNFIGYCSEYVFEY